jgi:uncharacterized membrane protein
LPVAPRDDPQDNACKEQLIHYEFSSALAWRSALGACRVALIDLHSAQTMSAASWIILSFAFITSNIIGCVLLQVGHQTRRNRLSTSIVLAAILFRFTLDRWCRQQSRQSFRHTLSDAIFLTPLTLLAVPTFEFFRDVIHWRAHGHGWVTE